MLYGMVYRAQGLKVAVGADQGSRYRLNLIGNGYKLKQEPRTRFRKSIP